MRTKMIHFLDCRSGLILWALIISITSTLGLSQDLQVLLNFKKELNDPLGHLDSWNASMPCSFWKGVACLGDGITVLNLSIPSQNISGTISPTLGMLKGLKMFIVSDNWLQGTIPAEIVNCSSLVQLDVSSNLISGRIPEDIGKLRNLEVLMLQKNQLNGGIPSSLSNCSQLIQFDASINQLTGSIPPELGNLKKLQQFMVVKNMLNGNIPAELGNCENLTSLLLWTNRFTGSMPSSLSRLDKLQFLDLSTNSLQGIIPVEFGKLRNLVQLLLGYNHLSGALPRELGNCSSLMLLDLMNNSFTGSIPSELAQLQQLEVLYLYRNIFSGIIPEELGKHSNLTILNLSYNQLDGDIPAGLCSGGAVENIGLSFNKLSGQIPKELVSCKGMTRLLLHHNKLSGHIPNEIGQNPSLLYVDFSFNNLDGSIPPELGNCSNLTAIIVAKNQLSGIVPVALGKLKQLALFDLSRNSFTGRVPAFVGEFNALTELLLDGNKFGGALPASWNNFEMLVTINLGSNDFSGSIPKELGSLKSLETMNLSRNHFLGNIPPELGNLVRLQTLDLSHNQLSDEIPSQMGKLQGLDTLDISYNQLQGAIPRSWQTLFQNMPSIFANNSQLCGLPTSRSCETARSKKLSTGVLAGIVCASAAFVGFLVLLLSRKLCTQKKRWGLTFVNNNNLTLRNIMAATNNFASEYKIGEGGYGIVYKAVLPSGEIVAVKMMKVFDNVNLADRSSVREVRSAGNVKHRNIVKLLGFFNLDDCELLVYEYMPNGSLGDLLYHANENVPWDTRYRIAVGTAYGLTYLHKDCSPTIIHRDIKSNNILLDDKMEPHIGDFGLAKLVEMHAGEINSMSYVAGSCGYIAPEYAYTLKVSEKSDVFSFGVVLLELLIGKAPLDPIFATGTSIVSWARVGFAEATLNSIIDSAIWEDASNIEKNEISLVLRIALFCTSDEPDDRPTMHEVVEMLRQVRVSHIQSLEKIAE